MTNYHIENKFDHEKYFRFTDSFDHFDIATINNLLNILSLTKELENSEIITCYFKETPKGYSVNGLAYSTPYNKSFDGKITFFSADKVIVNLEVTLLQNNQTNQFHTSLIFEENQILRITRNSLNHNLKEILSLNPNIQIIKLKK